MAVWLAGVLLGLAIPAAALAEPTGVITQHGEVTAVDIGPMAPEDSLNALSPGRTVGQMTFTNETDAVDATLCKRFGVAMRIVYAPGDKRLSRVLVRVIHPTLRRPDGATGTEDTFYSQPNGADVATAFTFDYGWEMAAGRWTWEFSDNGRVLASQSFDVTLPDGPLNPRSACEGPPLS